MVEIIPEDFQIQGSEDAYNILATYGLCYIAWEERVGKTLTGILTAEKCTNVKRVLIVTKKSALEGWHFFLDNYKTTKEYTVINYQSVHKVKGEFDLIILDEAHKYISGYPKRSGIWDKCREKTAHFKPVIFMSATPYAQGSQLLFNQLTLSCYSSWHSYDSYYDWFRQYAQLDDNGNFKTIRRSASVVAIDYTAVQHDRIIEETKYLFMTRTREQSGFKHEPKDVKHYIELSETTKAVYNELVKKKYLKFYHEDTDRELELVLDTPMKTRTSLHMLEGGVFKINDEPIILNNTEKVEYILDKWGDSEDNVIMYNYIPEKLKLERYFKKTLIRQATKYAEGVDFSKKKNLIIYSQDFSTASYSQRRARQANIAREEPIKVHFLLTKKGVSDKVYTTVAENKKNYVDKVFDRI